MKARAFLALAAISAAVAVCSFSGDARACEEAVELDFAPQKPTPVQEVARGEKALESGQNLVAAQAILGSFANVRSTSAGQSHVATRAVRVFALAIVRSNGEVNEKKAGFPSAGDWKPNANLEWAVQSLREIDGSRKNDPAVQADLGEALSKLPHGHAESLKLLSALAQKDLVGSPQAYAALAQLRSKSGDDKGAEAAIKRCEEISKTPGVCKPGSALPVKAAPAAAKPSFAAKA